MSEYQIKEVSIKGLPQNQENSQSQNQSNEQYFFVFKKEFMKSLEDRLNALFVKIC